MDPSGYENPTAKLRVHRDSPMVRVFRMPPIANRYLLLRSDEDTMIPDWYPGDHLTVDTKLEAKVGRIVVGFLDDEPIARRLVRDKKDLLLIASNRNYPPVPFVEKSWVHIGVVVYAMRDMGKRYSGPDLE